VTEEQAKDRCRELAETSPDRETHSWIARQGEGDAWSVVKLAVPPAKPPETTASKPTDPQSGRDDPRTSQQQNVPFPF